MLLFPFSPHPLLLFWHSTFSFIYCPTSAPYIFRNYLQGPTSKEGLSSAKSSRVVCFACSKHDYHSFIIVSLVTSFKSRASKQVLGSFQFHIDSPNLIQGYIYYYMINMLWPHWFFLINITLYFICAVKCNKFNINHENLNPQDRVIGRKLIRQT